MPIECGIAFPPMSEDGMRDLDFKVMHQAFETHNSLGRFCDEFVYEKAIARRLVDAGFESSLEVPIELRFRKFAKTLFIDLVVNRSVPYELKAVRELTTEHEQQLLIYMLLTNARRGKLINFRTELVTSRFVNATMTTMDRKDFNVDAKSWNGSERFREMVEALVLDWGTGLSVSLYTQAITANLGGQKSVVRQIAMNLGGHRIGSQRFHLAAPRTAFKITAFNRHNLENQGNHLRKMIARAEIDELYWVNVARHRLMLSSLRN